MFLNELQHLYLAQVERQKLLSLGTLGLCHPSRLDTPEFVYVIAAEP